MTTPAAQSRDARECAAVLRAMVIRESFRSLGGPPRGLDGSDLAWLSRAAEMLGRLAGEQDAKGGE